MEEHGLLWRLSALMQTCHAFNVLNDQASKMVLETLSESCSPPGRRVDIPDTGLDGDHHTDAWFGPILTDDYLRAWIMSVMVAEDKLYGT